MDNEEVGWGNGLDSSGSGQGQVASTEFDRTLAHNAPAAAAQCSRRGQILLARASVNSYDSCIAAVHGGITAPPPEEQQYGDESKEMQVRTLHDYGPCGNCAD